MEDTRNLVDEYKGMSNEEVFDALSKKRNSLEVAIENVEPHTVDIFHKS